MVEFDTGDQVPAVALEQFGRSIDPVRACALGQAVTVWQNGYVDSEGDQVARILQCADRFEAWLSREELSPE